MSLSEFCPKPQISTLEMLKYKMFHKIIALQSATREDGEKKPRKDQI